MDGFLSLCRFLSHYLLYFLVHGCELFAAILYQLLRFAQLGGNLVDGQLILLKLTGYLFELGNGFFVFHVIYRTLPVPADLADPADPPPAPPQGRGVYSTGK